MRNKKYVAPNFKKYEKFIINCPNYKGLPYKVHKDGSIGWVATGKSKIGRARKHWADVKAKELGISDNAWNKYEQVMFDIHPTKYTVCQNCGHKLSIKYLYPNKTFIKEMAKDNIITLSDNQKRYSSILDIFNKLNDSSKINKLKQLLINKTNLPCTINDSVSDIVNKAEYACRMKRKRALSPGAMSNFPDRYDGFHSFNRCCREIQDKGRHKSNMYSYGKDRRAYEYLSGGNIVAANELMHTKRLFKNESADHIGPISLGFKHDPYNLRKLSTAANEAKRDRLSPSVINLIIQREHQYHIDLMSRHGQIIWKHIKIMFNQGHQSKHDMLMYREILKYNTNNFMYLLWYISYYNQQGKNFIEKYYLLPRKKLFNYRFTFRDLNNLNNVSKHRKSDSKNVEKEYPRLKRISFTSIRDYHKKANRELKPLLNNSLMQQLKAFKTALKMSPYNDLVNKWNQLIQSNQKLLLHKFTM